MPMINHDIFHITENDKFIIDEATPSLPVDKNGIPIRIGDILLLKHNNKKIHVRFMHYCGDGIWHIFGNESGGGFALPESVDNVTHVFY